MRIVYPYVTVFPEALAALDGWPVEQVDVSSDDQAYYRLLADLWHSGEDFCLVEQDIVIPTGALQHLADCPEEWCAGVYWMPWGSWGSWFGMVRFRGSLTVRHPDLPESIEHRHWSALDSATMNHLRALGYSEPHRHEFVKHLTKGRGGLGVTVFVNCSGCGSALPTEEVERSPQPRCQDCGLVNETVVEPTTMTVPIL